MLKLMKRQAIAVGLLVVVLVLPSVADDRTIEKIAACAAIDDASERLACYDSLEGIEKSTPAKVAAPVAASVPVPPDELGSETVTRTDADSEDQSVVARVVSCSKDSLNDYYFNLDGGQVWKQLGDERFSFKNCDFNVTISKDYFGYKMQIDGKKGRFRVKRIR